ncbi:MAG: glycoside hydrolase family 88 protein [Anaerolineae bacterium]
MGRNPSRQDQPGEAFGEWSVKMADSVMKRHAPLSDRWRYEYGVVLKALEQVWLETGQQKYYDYIKENVDRFVDHEGNIQTYRLDEYNLDQINAGKILFRLYATTGDARYKRAAYLLREQLKRHPRTSEGGFWHKQIYPHQMWLDGIYMAAPFYAEFAKTFDEPGTFDDIVHQIILVESHTRDPKTGLLYHGWDESRSQKWANPETGCSPNFWGRSMGWYAMGVVDALDHLPLDHPKREKIVAILDSLLSALGRVQDQPTGLWYQVLDQGEREGNYLEASASCMVVYAMAKGVRNGYLDRQYLDLARRGYRGILEHFVEVAEQGLVNLQQICSVAGLGGTPYRDGSFDYYIGEPVVTNDYKGVGPFILASVEIERLKVTTNAAITVTAF